MAHYKRQDFYSLDNIVLYDSLGDCYLKYQKNFTSVYIESQEILT